MESRNIKNELFLNFKHIAVDIKAGLVVFVVALPLCLGIALASGAPVFAGIIAGIIGGLVIGSLSGSQVSVAGPAAGLTAIVLSGIATLKSYETFLLAVTIAGVFQIILGFFRAGSISSYFPSNVIEGMLVAIGIIIIVKQIPVGLGLHPENEGMLLNLYSETLSFPFQFLEELNFIHPGALIIFLLGLVIQIAWAKVSFLNRIQFIPAPLVVVIVSTLVNEGFIYFLFDWELDPMFLVHLPAFTHWDNFLNSFQIPKFSEITNLQVWQIAFTICLVASIETLLCIDAADKLDPLKRLTDPNRELKAQGIGNLLSGLLGGLPITSVIVRTTANINSGAKSKLSTILHGLFLALSVLLIPDLLSRIPISSLASILVLIGYKLANPSIFHHMWKRGKAQFLPFLVTVIAIVFTDLLKGVGIGLFVSIMFILKGNLELAYRFKKESYHDGELITIHLAEEISFLNKAAIKQVLMDLPKNSQVVIDFTNNIYIDYDVILLIKDFLLYGAKQRNINVKIRGHKKKHSMEEFNHITIS